MKYNLLIFCRIKTYASSDMIYDRSTRTQGARIDTITRGLDRSVQKDDEASYHAEAKVGGDYLDTRYI